MLGFRRPDKHTGMLAAMKHSLPLACALLLVACGDNDDGDDNTPPIDGAIDAAPSDGAIDAPSDGAIDAPSSVVVIPDCTGVTANVTVSAAGGSYNPQNSTLMVNQVLRFEPGGFHDIDSPGNFDTAPNQVVCLRFTAAGTFPIQCSIHQFTGMITVTN